MGEGRALWHHGPVPSPSAAGVPRVSRVSVALAELEELVAANPVPGSPLPSEAELVERLGLSRLTVREAMTAMQARGLIDVRQGRRPVVAATRSKPLQDFFQAAVRRDARGALDLLEIREAIEIQAASLAAARASRAQVTALEHALALMRDREDAPPDDYNEADVLFHESLVAAAGNQLLSLLVEGLAQPLRDSRLLSYRGHVRRGAPVSGAVQEHEAILAAVRDHSPARAAEAMRTHLRATSRDLREVLSSTTEPDPAADVRAGGDAHA